MKVLIAPMGAMAETRGPFFRATILGKVLIGAGHEVAFCAAEDVNYQKIEDIENYYSPIPAPLGLPMWWAKRMFKIIQALGIQERKTVHSYEEVLYFVGAIQKKFFSRDVTYIRKAIQTFKPDIVYAEFRLAAIVAAKLEKVKVVTGYSYPVQTRYAANPEFSKGVRKFLKQNGLPSIHSALDLFEWADLKIVASSYELEPIEGENIVFTGPFTPIQSFETRKIHNKILCYVGNGTLSPKQLISTLTEAFKNTKYEVYIATQQVDPYIEGNIQIAKRFDFNDLMPEAVTYIHHGGQNSIMTGLLYGVPQIVCPGNVFERKYNADSIVNVYTGIRISTEEFTASKLEEIINTYETNDSYRNQSQIVGEALIKLGGVHQVVEILESLYKSNQDL